MTESADFDTHAHTRRAVAGDADSLTWLVERLTPLLLAQAKVRLLGRLGARLRRVVDPHDLVQEVWAIALPRLPELSLREGVEGATLMAFLARTLVYRCNDLMRKYIIGKPQPAGSSLGMLARLPGTQSAAVTRAVRRETRDIVHDAIEQLDELDREVVVLRGMEHNPIAHIAAITGLSDNAVSQRYRRAVAKLRDSLPAETVALFALER